jgi:hypothetical protein
MLVKVGLRSGSRKQEHDIAVEKLRHSGEFFLGGMTPENERVSEPQL